MVAVRGRAELASRGIDWGLRGLSRAGWFHPASRVLRRGVRVNKNIAYRPGGKDKAAWRLDVYRPAASSGPLPALLYLHGGGFRTLSKDTHWVFGYAFARRGFVVFNVNYRLAPRYPYPAALEDAADALGWVLANAAQWAADPERLVLAGESAGANLALALAVGGFFTLGDPLADRLRALGARPRAILAACGFLQVSDGDRYLKDETIPDWVRARIARICRAYLPHQNPQNDDRFLLADPLLVLERAEHLDPSFPAVFAPCGTRDFVVDDTARLGRALERLGADAEVPFYEGVGHAFHAFHWKPIARQCWSDTTRFLSTRIEGVQAR